MKILAVSDRVDERLYSRQLKKAMGDVDLVLGCGDLPYYYLEFIVTVLNVPLYYVPGNHDPEFSPLSPATYAEGCINIDQKLINVKGLLIAGLGGSHRYRPDGVNQFSQSEMAIRAMRLALKAAWRKRRYRQPLDILVTHSPPFGIHDDTDLAHQGYRIFNSLISWLRPRYLLHGHTHFYRLNVGDYETSVDSTIVLNVFPYQVIEF